MGQTQVCIDVPFPDDVTEVSNLVHLIPALQAALLSVPEEYRSTAFLVCDEEPAFRVCWERDMTAGELAEKLFFEEWESNMGAAGYRQFEIRDCRSRGLPEFYRPDLYRKPAP